MLTLFAVPQGTVALILSNEIGAVAETFDSGLGAAADPENIPGARTILADKAHDLAEAIGNAAIAAPAPYQARVLSVWRTLDAALVVGGAVPYTPDGPLVLHVLAELQAVGIDVAYQVAAEAT